MKKLLSILFLFSLSLSAQVSKNRLMTTGYGWKNRVVPTNAYLDSTFSSFWMPEGNSVGTNNPIVGTLNNKPLYFVTNSLTAVTIGTNQTVAFSNSITAPLLNNIYHKRGNFIYTLGDSQTEGGEYQTQLVSLLGSTWNYNDFGVGGERTDAMLARITGLTNGAGKHAIVWAGINDILIDIPAATIEANLQSIYTNLKDSGFTVVSITIPPFGSYTGWTAGRQIICDAVNTWITNTAINVDYKIDVYSLLEGTTDVLNPTYDSGDGLHLNLTGYNLVGTTIYNNATFTANTNSVNLILGKNITIEQSLSPSNSPVFKNLMLSGALYLQNTPSSSNYFAKPINLTSIGLNTQNTLFFRVNDVTVGSYNSSAFTTNTYLQINNSSSDNKMFFYRTGGNDYSFQQGTTSFYLYNNTTNKLSWRAYNNGNLSVGSESVLSTSATDGFLYIPSCAGTPTGVPTAITGKIPIVADGTNNKLYIYSGGAWVPLN